jgi:hypothetical protein
MPKASGIQVGHLACGSTNWRILGAERSLPGWEATGRLNALSAYKQACMQACRHAYSLLGSASKLVAFVNSKGGVGKSTIAVHYAVAEREKGRRVALIDSDVQESSTRWLKELADGISVYRLPTPDDVLEEAPKLKEQYDLVIADGPAGLSEVARAILLRG